jgi:capsular polysaccharide export protein
LLLRARKLHQSILKYRLTKYNVGVNSKIELSTQGRTVVLVPGQVENDASILRGSPTVKKNYDFLKIVREAQPKAFIVFKPHPDVVAGSRRGMVPLDKARQWCDLILTDVSMARLLEVVDQVHTMTSLTGFEALLRGKQVVTYGLPFYAGWGLTKDLLSTVRRCRKLSLEQLIAGTLILYPTYVDPESRQICSVEDSLGWLVRNSGDSSDPSWRTQIIRFFQHLR